jgi:hypothetical protein
MKARYSHQLGWLILALVALLGLFAFIFIPGPSRSPSAYAAGTKKIYLPFISAMPAFGSPTLGGCTVFPPDNPWNADISNALVDANSDAYIASINQFAQYLHADFGSNLTYGIPYTIVASSQVSVPITFVDWPEQSDPGPYPIPLYAPVESGSDDHVPVAQSGACKLFELYNAQQIGNGWQASNGAVFDFTSNASRPNCWTSADAAGLPILPGLVRYDEVAAGAINHAVRFTVQSTQQAFVHPGTHYASSITNTNYPPMGLRVRLKASYSIFSFYGQARVVLNALKKYGMFVADNGSSWYITGATDSRWNDTDLDQLKTVPGSAFEVVQVGTIYHAADCP